MRRALNSQKRRFPARAEEQTRQELLRERAVASARERTRADAAVAAAKAENRRLQAVAVERERARRAPEEGRDGGQHGGGGRRGGWTEVGGKSRQGGRGERGGPRWPAVVGSAQVKKLFSGSYHTQTLLLYGACMESLITFDFCG